jgi:hypothetical protein
LKAKGFDGVGFVTNLLPFTPLVCEAAIRKHSQIAASFLLALVTALIATALSAKQAIFRGSKFEVQIKEY